MLKNQRDLRRRIHSRLDFWEVKIVDELDRLILLG